MNAEPPRPGSPPVVDANGYLIWDRLSESQGLLRDAVSWVGSRSALAFSARQAAARFGRVEAPSAYAKAYARFVENGLSAEEWDTVEAFYGNLIRLGEQHDFTTVAVVMPAIDIVSGPSADSHPYPVAARRLLSGLGIPAVDGFALWAQAGEGQRHFLPQGPDAHLDAEGYRIVADAVADVLLKRSELRTRLASPAGALSPDAVNRRVIQ